MVIQLSEQTLLLQGALKDRGSDEIPAERTKSPLNKHMHVFMSTGHTEIHVT